MNLELDKTNAALLGVCSGIARAADVDPLLVRITVLLASVLLAPVAIPAYLFAGLTWKRAPEPASAKILYYRQLTWGREQALPAPLLTFDREAA